MKRLRKLHRFASTFAAATLVASACLSVSEVHAQSSETQEKIRLMATALRARESGELMTAQANLEELLRKNPDDQNVQRLLDAVNKDIERQNAGQPTVYGQAAGVSDYTPKDISVTDSTTVVSMSNSDGTETTTEVILTGGDDVDYLMASAATEQQAAIARGEQAIADAEVLVENGRSDEADAILAAAQESIPESTATEFIIEDLRTARGDIILAAGKKALKEHNAVAAEAAALAYRDTLGEDARLATYEEKVEELKMDPWRQDPEKLSPEYVQRVKTTDQLLVTARAMMLYGDYEGAQSKLREVEARDPINAEAKSLQMEIMQQVRKSAWLDHGKTRDQMLEEVSRGWQRPQVYDLETNITSDPTISPIEEKLKSIYIPRVSFSSVPLSRVIETLSELSVEYDPDVNAEDKDRGVNIVLFNNNGRDPSVNITLRSLSLDRILDFATESVGFTWDISDETVIVSPGNEQGQLLETEFFPIGRQTIIRLTGGGGDSGSSSSAVSDPFSAPAAPSGPSGGDEEEAIRDFFSRAGINFDEPGASLVFDGTQLIVTQSPKNLEKMRNILRRYDQTKQVEIEAKFLDVIQGNLDELGFNWGIANPNSPTTKGISSSNQTLANVFSTETEDSNIVIKQLGQPDDSIAAGSPSIPNVIDLGALGGVAGTFMGIVEGVDLSVTVNALAREEGSDLLSAPKLTVLSGRTAQIVVAQELRYPENYGDIEAEVSPASSTTTIGGSSGSSAVAITAGTPQDFSVRNIGVEMEVTPTVEENDNISLKLEPRVTEFEGFVEYGGPSVAIAGGTTVTVPSGFYQPIFSTREVRTEVTIFDGATVVIGGLTREEIKTIEDKVPVLGDIPFLGRLFMNKGETAQKRNLLIFVTANLISPGGSPARQSIGSVEANSLFQSPVVVTPGGGVGRSINE
ncbi:type II secretion system protein GspD [Cerasicoccus frondis]|uniref:type II secretion system protein GspD n=1 Tax=Cerasicoccus frondis TaxID=490090 RepID=UPI002852CC1F|nr:hypothetical protein [Cerasicoccus frondis]